MQLRIAGVGASAGGLEAMLPMFAQMPRTGGIAFVVAQHMAHGGHSELVARLIARESALPVVLARETEHLQADTVYVIPAGKDGVVADSTLRLCAPSSASLSTPSINALFGSLAEARGGDAIGIILSGTGTDGTAGCRALRARGALTIAQLPEEAKFNGMPGAAIEARVVDKVLAVADIGKALAAMFPGVASPPPSQSASATPAAVESASPTALRELERLLPLVHQATGIDFSSYKEDTLLRRLEKRKSMLGIADADAYLERVRRQPGELHALQRLFLVSVSSFFRDRDAFRELERALAGRLAGKPAGEAVRVWVPGCASGEEPYTLAIVLNELLGEHRSRHPIAIVGSDLNGEALDVARAGIYRQTALAEMEDALRGRYFVARGQHYEVGRVLREAVVFEARDVLSGPPAGGFDLVSCRNLLIYLKSPLQGRLIESFHRALLPQGLLFIGQSESLGFGSNPLFAPIDNYHRLFRRQP